MHAREEWLGLKVQRRAWFEFMLGSPAILVRESRCRRNSPLALISAAATTLAISGTVNRRPGSARPVISDDQWR